MVFKSVLLASILAPVVLLTVQALDIDKNEYYALSPEQDKWLDSKEQTFSVEKHEKSVDDLAKEGDKGLRWKFPDGIPGRMQGLVSTSGWVCYSDYYGMHLWFPNCGPEAQDLGHVDWSPGSQDTVIISATSGKYKVSKSGGTAKNDDDVGKFKVLKIGDVPSDKRRWVQEPKL